MKELSYKQKNLFFLLEPCSPLPQFRTPLPQHTHQLQEKEVEFKINTFWF